MLRFNILEVLNKIIGFGITALISRMLANDFGTYLYYQTVFGYLYAFALFSSDYNFLVNFKINKNYLQSTAYYHTILLKIALVFLVILFTIIFLLPSFTHFSFWPYVLAVIVSLFTYDFILYVEDDKKRLIFYRMVSQIVTLAGALLFYFHLIDVYYVTVLQIIQTMILTFGTFMAAKKYVPRLFHFKKFMEAATSISPSVLFENSSYFLIRNFITFFTTIEIVLLAQSKMLKERNIFAEGLRLAGILTPFVLFYINFNINKIKKGYYTLITLCGIALLLLSPLYVFLFFGDNFIQNIYFYNFFILVFIFNAFIEKDSIELLTDSNSKKTSLLYFNSVCFLVSLCLFIILINSSVPLLWLITVFSLKLLLYYFFFLRKFNLRIQYSGVLVSFVTIPTINVILELSGYFEFALRNLKQFKNQLL